ncbi:MAG: hypothetical protein HC845_14825 [Akkermansiaceae bacterium]|nr:hypothetical protein [Akkermansiaceae bacterium]
MRSEVHLAAVRLLTLKIQEPLPGFVLPEMAADHGPDEAARRYRAIAVTTLRQLQHLADSRIRLAVEPNDANEAVRFWLLPRLAEHWQAEGQVFRSAGWEIDFGDDIGDFSVYASGEILCPNLGARWVHTALLGMGQTAHLVTGPAIHGGVYFRATTPNPPPHPLTRILPELTIIQTSEHWEQALDSPLGPALKRAWEQEA